MNLQPGTELEIELSQKFGWEAHIYGNGRWVYARNKRGDPGFYFNASREWSGMQLVVEEMQRRGWIFTLNYDGYKWIAAFMSHKDVPYAEGESAPHAVCLAAISALEGQADA